LSQRVTWWLLPIPVISDSNVTSTTSHGNACDSSSPVYNKHVTEKTRNILYYPGIMEPTRLENVKAFVKNFLIITSTTLVYTAFAELTKISPGSTAHHGVITPH
jgi:hypothetical protein